MSKNRRAFVDPVWVKDLFRSASFENLLSVLDIRQGMAPVVKSGDYKTCPCCEQTVKLYPRSVNSEMIRQLVLLARKGPQKFMRVSHVRGGDYAKLLHWGLVESVEIEDEKRSAITKKGIDWLAGRITIPRYALIYNREVYGWSREEWTIREAAKKDFDLHEILAPFQLSDDMV